MFTLSDPYRNLPGGVGPFPFEYDPANPRFTFPAQVFGPSLDFVWPKTYQMNVTIEKELFRNVSVSASYVGALGRNLPASIERTTRCSDPGRRRPTSTRGGLISRACSAAARVLESIFTSDYHGLQLAAEKRGGRFSAKAYSGRPAIEDLDYQGGGLPAVQNSCLTGERGRTSADRTHTFAFSGIWRNDYFGDAKRIARALLNDWTLSAIVTLQSGAPLTITAGQDRNFDGETNDRADLVGDPARPRPAARRADRAVVQYRGLRAAGGGRGRQRAAQHRGRARREERRPGGVPRHPACRPLVAAVPGGSDEHLQHREPVEPGHESRRGGDVRENPHRARHAEDSAGDGVFVLVQKRRGVFFVRFAPRARPCLYDYLWS